MKSRELVPALDTIHDLLRGNACAIMYTCILSRNKALQSQPARHSFGPCLRLAEMDCTELEAATAPRWPLLAAFGRFWPPVKDLLPFIRYDSATSGRFRRTYCAWPGKSPAKLSSGIGTFSARTASSWLHSRLTGARGSSRDSCLPSYGSQ